MKEEKDGKNVATERKKGGGDRITKQKKREEGKYKRKIKDTMRRRIIRGK